MENSEKARKDKKFYGRVTIDFPPELYDIMRKSVKSKGQSFKGYIVNLVAGELDFDLGYDDE